MDFSQLMLQSQNKGTDKPKRSRQQQKPVKKEAAAPSTPVHQPPPPSGTPLEPSDDHDEEEEDYDDGAGTGCAPGKKKRGLKNPFKKKVKEKKQTSRKSSSGSIKSPVAPPHGSPLSKRMVIKELNRMKELSSSYEVVPKDSGHAQKMKELESEPSAKYSLHSSSDSNVPTFVESETIPKLVSVCVCVCVRAYTYICIDVTRSVAHFARPLLDCAWISFVYLLHGRLPPGTSVPLCSMGKLNKL